MVLKNIKAIKIGEVYGVVFKLGFQILSCLFRLGPQDKNCSIGVLFLSDGVGGHYHSHPTYKVPIAGNMSFSSVELENGY
jgi:hypothetical protein